MLCDIKFGFLLVRENEISLRKWSGGAAQLRTLEETLVIDDLTVFTRHFMTRGHIPGRSFALSNLTRPWQ